MAEQYEYVLDCEPQPEGIQHILSADVERVLSLATMKIVSRVDGLGFSILRPLPNSIAT